MMYWGMHLTSLPAEIAEIALKIPKAICTKPIQ